MFCIQCFYLSTYLMPSFYKQNCYMTLSKKIFKYNGCYLDNMYEYQILILIFEKHT